MGWYKVSDLKVRERCEDSGFNPPEEAAIWSRGGCEGVMVVWRGKVELLIPRAILYELVGDDLRTRCISNLESMSGRKVIEVLSTRLEGGQ